MKKPTKDDFDTNRAKVLLRAAYDLIKRNDSNRFVEAAGETVVMYDDCNCDGITLMEDIMYLLDLPDNTKPIKLKTEGGDE